MIWLEILPADRPAVRCRPAHQEDHAEQRIVKLRRLLRHRQALRQAPLDLACTRILLGFLVCLPTALVLLVILTAALAGLGSLADIGATATVQGLTNDPETRVATAAKEALRKLSEQKPAAPEEVVALRKDLADLKDANSKLKDQLDDLRKQVESLAAPDAKE